MAGTTKRKAVGPASYPPTPAGWSDAAWANHLRYLAGRCETNRPDLAEHYRGWAAFLAQRIEAADRRRQRELPLAYPPPTV